LSDLVDDRALDGRTVIDIPVLAAEPMKRALFKHAPFCLKIRSIGMILCCQPSRKIGPLLLPVLNGMGLLGLNKILLESPETNVRVGHILSLCAQRDNYPIMFHCTHGKDRTGIVAALLLSVLGVPRDIIVEDYAMSEKLIPSDFFAKNTNSAFKLDPTIWGRSPPSVIRDTLAWMEKQYGSVDRYLDRIGFDHVKRQALRAAIITYDSQIPASLPESRNSEDIEYPDAASRLLAQVAPTLSEAQHGYDWGPTKSLSSTITQRKNQ